MNIVATYTDFRYLKAERSARRLGLAIGIISIYYHGMRWDAVENELARMRLAQAVESSHCGLAQNLEELSAGNSQRNSLAVSECQEEFKRVEKGAR